MVKCCEISLWNQEQDKGAIIATSTQHYTGDVPGGPSQLGKARKKKKYCTGL